MAEEWIVCGTPHTRRSIPRRQRHSIRFHAVSALQAKPRAPGVPNWVPKAQMIDPSTLCLLGSATELR